eukprot:scaffold100819_cov39-Phaeocystis_antarctica.AAC.1
MRPPEACSGAARSLRSASWPKPEPACFRHSGLRRQPVLAEGVEVHVQAPRGGAADQVGPEALEEPGPPLEAHDAPHAVDEPAVHR